MKNLLILAPCPSTVKQQLHQQFGDSFQISYADANAPKWAFEQADVIIGEPSILQIKTATNLKWLQITWAGTDRYTRNSDFPRHILLTNASGAFGTTISEYVIGAILAQYRRFPDYWQQQQNAVWNDLGSERTLSGKTALLLGTGDVGSAIAKRLKVFGTTTIGIHRHATPLPDEFDFTATLSELDALLPKADLVIGCLPHTPATQHLLHLERLLRMKTDALLINVGRGSLIVMDDLKTALQKGHLSGVILDVMEPEPLPPNHPLWKMPRVWITPHISGVGFHHDPGTEKKIWDICMENLKRYQNQMPLKNIVNLEQGY